jgi:hypothetical protein
VETDPGGSAAAVQALSVVRTGSAVRILGGVSALEGRAPRYELRYTTDGSEPGTASPRYRGPVEAAPGLRAGLLVQGRPVATLAIDAAKFRVPASAPPDHRERFNR